MFHWGTDCGLSALRRAQRARRLGSSVCITLPAGCPRGWACREVQRILMELLTQMDGFEQSTNVKVGKGLPVVPPRWAALVALPGWQVCMVAALGREQGAAPLDALAEHCRAMFPPGQRAIQGLRWPQHAGVVAAAWVVGLASYALSAASLGCAAHAALQVIMATNRADTLDPALLRPGRLDRKIEFPLPDRRQKRLVFQVARDEWVVVVIVGGLAGWCVYVCVCVFVCVLGGGPGGAAASRCQRRPGGFAGSVHTGFARSSGDVADLCSTCSFDPWPPKPRLLRSAAHTQACPLPLPLPPFQAQACTANMNLSEEVDLEDYVARPDKINNAEIASICQVGGACASFCGCCRGSHRRWLPTRQASTALASAPVLQMGGLRSCPTPSASIFCLWGPAPPTPPALLSPPTPTQPDICTCRRRRACSRCARIGTSSCPRTLRRPTRTWCASRATRSSSTSKSASVGRAPRSTPALSACCRPNVGFGPGGCGRRCQMSAASLTHAHFPRRLLSVTNKPALGAQLGQQEG